MKGKRLLYILRKAMMAILVLWLIILILFLIEDPIKTLKDLLALASINPVMTVITLWLLYAFKSLTIFFPLLVLEISAGHLFSPMTAAIVNLVGLAISLLLPYQIGKDLGEKAAKSLVSKYPKFNKIVEYQNENKFFLSFLVRIVNFLPGDLVSIYFGATGMPLFDHMVGGLLGMFPSMLLATLMGESIQDPSSPLFYVSTGLSILLAVFSSLGYYIYQRRHANGDK